MPAPVPREPRLDRGSLYWAQPRPGAGGGLTLMVRRPGVSEPGELTPAPFQLRSRVHEFGGGLYAVHGDDLVFVNGADGGLWWLDQRQCTEPVCLLLPHNDRGDRLGDGVIDPHRRQWIGVCDSHDRDRLLALPLAGGDPVVLRQQASFCGSPALAPDGTGLAWLEWDLPWMPWERTSLWWSPLGPRGELLDPQRIAGGDDAPQSLFQPLWTPAGDLLVVSDRSGWWNLQRCRPGGDGPWQTVGAMAAECGLPQWVCGQRTVAVAAGRLLALFCVEGRWQLCHRPLEGPDDQPWQSILLPWSDLSDLVADDRRLICLAADPARPPQLLERSVPGTPASPSSLEPPEEQPSPMPHDLRFRGGDGHESQAWYYPPLAAGEGLPPLLVRCHGGPTGMARTALQPAIRFWRRRGWGVVDVNYAGSTGFGRRYRERLDGRWGELDVADCAAAARAVIARGWADPGSVAIEGGSAGGLTTLAALIADPVFRAGACRYAVTDLARLRHDTHRFESGYLDRLIGPWPGAEALDRARSPLHRLDSLRQPVILFQGLQDRVVPQEQTEILAMALRRRGGLVELVCFEDEGHGFRSPAIQRFVQDASERFFRRVLGLPALAFPSRSSGA